MNDFDRQREQMVQQQILARGVSDARVLRAMLSVPREAFVPAAFQDVAYADKPLPIAGGQTISQPHIVACMIAALALKGGEKVLEVGAGSGYAAAVLAELATEVYAVERIEQLAELAARHLDSLGYQNAHVCAADGSLGWRDEAPFDAILVSAGAPSVPESLKAQLAVGGRLVIPIGRDVHAQELIRITRLDENDYQCKHLADVRFVPLIGEEGWELSDPAPKTMRQRVTSTFRP